MTSGELPTTPDELTRDLRVIGVEDGQAIEVMGMQGQRVESELEDEAW